MKPDQNKHESLFNAGLAKLERIHQQKNICHVSRISREWEVMMHALCNIRAEINERMSPEERCQADKMEAALRAEIGKFMCRKRATQGVFYVGDLHHQNLLKNYMLFLGDLEFKYGLSLPDKPADYLAQDL